MSIGIARVFEKQEKLVLDREDAVKKQTCLEEDAASAKGDRTCKTEDMHKHWR